MGLQSVVEKLDRYFKRLDRGEAKKIKPSHVARVIRKLERKKAELLEKLAVAGTPDKQQRLHGKIDTVDAQLERAYWLQERISSPDPPEGGTAPR